MSSPGHTDRTRGKRLPELASHDLADLQAILDAALVAHICVVDGDQPFVLPVAFARNGDTLYIHGSSKSR
ncbi:MAG: pyridoxamine 5'-phosphate oxidase family protein, partial [Actinobacteria bacterium]|nr:pyridoxamine 5'-phosphate oxidase family protein [Actinomycetota bacterium]